MPFWQKSALFKRRPFLFLRLVLFSLGCLVTLAVLKSLLGVCLRGDAYRSVGTLCDKYSRGLVAGNLCEDFCSHGSSNISAIIPESCETFHFEKDLVFMADIGRQQVVVRSTSFQHGLLTFGDWGPENFAKKIRNYVKDQVGLDVLPRSFQRTYQSLNTWVQRSSFWSVLQCKEFVNVNVYAELGIVPEVLGNCGNFYVVEKVTPMTFPPGIFDFPDRHDWLNRLQLALQLVQFSSKLDQGLHGREPLVYCDVKAEHFGYSKDQELNILDSDALFTKSKINSIIGTSKKCDSHADCDLLDCQGFCHAAKGQCLMGIFNNNLQIFCEKLFLGWRRRPKIQLRGLLTSGYASTKLIHAVELCANPAGSSDLNNSRRTHANKTVSNTLSEAIQRHRGHGRTEAVMMRASHY